MNISSAGINNDYEKSTVRIIEADYTCLNHMKVLYRDLHDMELSVSNLKLREVWDEIISDERVHPFILFKGKIPASTCTLSIIPNLTWDARPYGIIENVVTKKEFRQCGYAREILKYAVNFAWDNNCYKLMLLTGRKEEYVTRMYESVGFKSDIKTGMAIYNSQI